MPDQVRTIKVGGWGFWITWGRLAFIVIACAFVPAMVTAKLLLADKVSVKDQTEAFRQGCSRNVGTVTDITDIVQAEVKYKRAVLAASSVKSDVKTAADAALTTYDSKLPRLRRRIIVCSLAFPETGKPKVVVQGHPK